MTNAQQIENGKVYIVQIETEIDTEEQLDITPEIPKDQQIAELKEKLTQTDYKAIKYAEGWISEEDYAEIKAERQSIRDEINRIEGEINAEN